MGGTALVDSLGVSQLASAKPNHKFLEDMGTFCCLTLWTIVMDQCTIRQMDCFVPDCWRNIFKQFKDNPQSDCRVLCPFEILESHFTCTWNCWWFS